MTKKESIPLFLLLITGSTLVVLIVFPNTIEAQTDSRNQTQNSSIHNAKGHESHQVVNLQNATDNNLYNGTVIFYSSKPVDIISYKDISGIENGNSSLKVWQVGIKNFTPTTLLKNTTNGTVSFEGSGILTHSTMSEPYNVTFNTNTTTLDRN